MLHEVNEIIKKRHDKSSLVQSYQALLVRIIIIALTIYIALGHVFLVNQVKGMNMFPAVKDGDLYIAFRLQSHYEKNDILVYEDDGVKRIGRVIARENEIVEIDEEGILRVNGTIQSGEIMYPTYPENNIEYPYKVPDKHIFVLGDFRTQSLDSRNLGAIPRDKIIGKMITIIRRQGI